MIRRTLLKAAAMTWIPGSNPPQRPDQLLQQLTRAGSGPSPQSPFIVARRVVIIGPTGGLFVYSPTAGAGNLIASIAGAAGTDQYGNAVLQGDASYNPGTGIASAIVGGTFVAYTGPLGGAGPWSQQFAIITAPTGARTSLQASAQLDLFAPQTLIATSGGAGIVTSALLEVQGNIAFGGSTAATIATASTDATGYPGFTDPATLALNFSGCQPASGNKNTVTGTTFANLAFGTIPANDAEANAVYEVECGGYGTQAGGAAVGLTLQARFGASPGAATDVVGVAYSNSFPTIAGDSFQWSAKVRAECLTSGVAATWRIYLTGTITDTTAGGVPGVSFAVGTGPTDITQSSTAAINMGLSAEWASAVGAPTITKSGSQFGRRG